MDCIVHGGCKEKDMTEQLSLTHTVTLCKGYWTIWVTCEGQKFLHKAEVSKFCVVVFFKHS